MEPLVLGDKVRCKAGGPSMVIGSINMGVVMPMQQQGQQAMCLCYWWNDMSSTFQQWNFPIGALERID